ncbi:MAG: hypothetical protein ACKERG_03435 [Candidatus Hodgkinia cicadicola]
MILNGLTPPAPYGGEGEEGKPRTPQFQHHVFTPFLTSPSASAAAGSLEIEQYCATAAEADTSAGSKKCRTLEATFGCYFSVASANRWSIGTFDQSVSVLNCRCFPASNEPHYPH